jgi:hypothetical protein
MMVRVVRVDAFGGMRRFWAKLFDESASTSVESEVLISPGSSAD